MSNEIETEYLNQWNNKWKKNNEWKREIQISDWMNEKIIIIIINGIMNE